MGLKASFSLLYIICSILRSAFSAVIVSECENKSVLILNFQIKRQQAKAYFAKAIEEMYGDLAETAAASQKILKL